MLRTLLILACFIPLACSGKAAVDDGVLPPEKPLSVGVIMTPSIEPLENQPTLWASAFFTQNDSS